SGSVMYNKDRPALSTVEGLQRAKQLARRLNCDEYDYKWLDCLRAIDDPNLFIEKPDFDVELMTGATKDEGLSLAMMLYPEMSTDMTEHQLRELVIRLSDEYRNINVDKVCDHYLKGVDKTNSLQLKAAFSALYGDLVMTCPTYLFAKNVAKSGQNVQYFAKMFGDTGDAVCHGADIPFVYGLPLRYPQQFSETEYDFIKHMTFGHNFGTNL
ncbi:unnamed protein product, partial [Medioppia subpectinata]